jgi:hypothetical protein
MEKLTADPYAMSSRKTSRDSASVTFSAAYSDGPTPYDWQECLMTILYGPGVVPASLSAELENDWERQMKDICGLSSEDSSKPATLQSRLANRLVALMDVNGSPEYKLTWKHWDLSSGLRICRLVASPRPITERVFTGWPTPNVRSENRGGLQSNPAAAAAARIEQGHQLNLDDAALEDQVQLVAWATPRAEDAESCGMRHSRGVADTLTAQVSLVAWSSPKANEKVQSLEAHRKGFYSLMEQASGVIMTSQSATILTRRDDEKPGALNPAHSLWLMGFPTEFLSCGVQAMQSIRSLPRSSSKRRSGPSKTRELTLDDI